MEKQVLSLIERRKLAIETLLCVHVILLISPIKRVYTVHCDHPLLLLLAPYKCPTKQKWLVVVLTIPRINKYSEHRRNPPEKTQNMCRIPINNDLILKNINHLQQIHFLEPVPPAVAVASFPFALLPVNDNESLLLLVMAVMVLVFAVDFPPPPPLIVIVDSITAIDFRRVISSLARFSAFVSEEVKSALRLLVGENSTKNKSN